MRDTTSTIKANAPFVGSEIIFIISVIVALAFSAVGSALFVVALSPHFETFDPAWRFCLAAALVGMTSLLYLVLRHFPAGIKSDETEASSVYALKRIAKGKVTLMVTPGISHVSCGYHTLPLPHVEKKIEAYTDGVHFLPFCKLTQKDARAAGYRDLLSLQAALEKSDPSFNGMSVVTLCLWEPEGRPYTPARRSNRSIGKQSSVQ